jgi:hypothetical protein
MPSNEALNLSRRFAARRSQCVRPLEEQGLRSVSGHSAMSADSDRTQRTVIEDLVTPPLRPRPGISYHDDDTTRTPCSARPSSGGGYSSGLFALRRLPDPENTRAVQRTNALSSLSLGHDWDAWLRDREFASTYDTGIRDYSSLSGADKLQFDRYIGQGLNIWEFAYYSTDAGTMDKETWEAWDRFFRSQLGHDSWRLVWNDISDAYGSGFQVHVNEQLSNR